MYRLFLLIFIIFLVSCGVKKTSVRLESYTISEPELNKISTKEIGIALVSKEKGYEYDAIKITKEFKIKLNGFLKVFEEGNIFINQYNTNEYYFYKKSSNAEFGIAIPRSGKNPLIYTYSDNDGIYSTGFIYNGLSLISPKEQVEYVQTKSKAKDKEYFKQEFIYNGRIGNALKFIYREYLNDYVRPAFTQDLQYDLSERKTIGFRGLRIEIMNVTNTEIEYKVLNYFEK